MNKINHNKFNNAVTFLAERLNREYPDKYYILAQAKLHPRSASWGLEVIVPIPENAIMDITRKPPTLVSLDEIGDDETISLEGVFIEIHHVDKAIEIADEFIQTNRQLLQASLVDVLNLSTKIDTIWHLIYDCRDLAGRPFAHIMKVDMQTASIVSSEIFRPENTEL